jgi:hypothetical protein
MMEIRYIVMFVVKGGSLTSASSRLAIAAIFNLVLPAKLS